MSKPTETRAAQIRYSSAADIWTAYPYVVYTGEYSVELKNAKLEPGTTATPFVAPNEVMENVKIKCSSDIGAYNGIPADTLDGFNANEIASNPNLLINPDFKINQRGQTEYTGTGYTVDHWWINNNTTTLTQISNGIKVRGISCVYCGGAEWIVLS